MERPYRSHLQPACHACRRRKSRCKQDDLSASCLMCQVHGTTCEFPIRNENRQASKVAKNAAATAPLEDLRHVRADRRRTSRSAQYLERETPSKVQHPRLGKRAGARIESAIGRSRRTRISQNTEPLLELHPNHNQDRGMALDQYDRLSDTAIDEHSIQMETPHIIGPMATTDANALQKYLGNNQEIESTRIVRPAKRSMLAESRMHDPILFKTISKRPIGMRVPQNPGQSQLQIIEKLIEPHADRLINAYFDHFNGCFPLLDVESFKLYCIAGKEKLSPALLACLYANAMILWGQTIGSEEQRCPDTRFIWVQAEEAIRAELLLSPGMSTVVGILLDVGGRPTTSMLGNAISMGAVVSLSHALGLNRDPSEWSIPDNEKSLRIRLWWAVIIHDRWCSLAYGTPPHIHKSQYDVPLPSFPSGPSNSSVHAAGTMFAHLSSLTEVLGDCLQYVYRLNASYSYKKSVGQDVERFLIDVERWESSLDTHARDAVVHGSKHDISGAANLRLAYLSLRMHLQRIRLDEQKPSEHIDQNLISKLQVLAEKAAEQVVDFIGQLECKHIMGFWHPISAFSIASACTLLIRCAIETHANDPVGLSRSRGVKKADELLATLKMYKTEYAWDVGDICISQCERVVQELLEATGFGHMNRSGEGANEDFENEILVVDELFPSLWDLVDLDYGVEYTAE